MLVSEAMALTDGHMAGMVLDMDGVTQVTFGVIRDMVGATQDMAGVTQATVGATRDTDGVTQATDGAIRDMDGDIIRLTTRDIRVITALELMANVMLTIRGEMQHIRGLTQGTSVLKTNSIRQEDPPLQEIWPRPMIRTDTELPTETAVLRLKTADPIAKDQITADLMRVQMVIINLEITGQEITTAGHRITTADRQHLLTGVVHPDIAAALQVQEAVREDAKCHITMLITN